MLSTRDSKSSCSETCIFLFYEIKINMMRIIFTPELMINVSLNVKIRVTREWTTSIYFYRTFNAMTLCDKFRL